MSQIDGMTILDKINLEINEMIGILIMGTVRIWKIYTLELIYGLHVSKDGVQKYNGIQRQLVSGDNLKKHIGFFYPGIKDFYESLKFNIL